MTADEIKITSALAHVSFFPGTKTKRLAESMAAMATNRPEQPLTPRQHDAIVDIAIKFRRQIPDDVVDLARSLKGDE